ncbi:hypothetical protein [Laspinema olomoucense]|uniref:hypothetical protein n=1 Tax=Laspinema olomoucense TaxID=3231600 RepID=UPI0021BB7AAA|nr:hypothetical protein [Laspinema sp. D3d]MCT7971130.1 hypothetical protein [Laspinema sp. D3d]
MKVIEAIAPKQRPKIPPWINCLGNSVGLIATAIVVVVATDKLLIPIEAIAHQPATCNLVCVLADDSTRD